MLREEATESVVRNDRTTENSSSSDIGKRTHSGLAVLQQCVAILDKMDTREPGLPQANLLVVVDQFEELFRDEEVDPWERERLIELIRYVEYNKPEGVVLALVMRSEDLHRCAEEPVLANIVNNSFVFVDWLNRDDLKKAIVEPAQIYLQETYLLDYKGEFSPYERQLVDKLLDDAELLRKHSRNKGDHLPLLQHGLKTLWAELMKARDAQDKGREDSQTKEDRSNSRVLLKTDLYIGLVDTARKYVTANYAIKKDEVVSDLQWLLIWEAELALRQAEVAFSKYLGKSGLTVDGVLSPENALRAAFCEIASVDENSRYYRKFRKVKEIADIRFGMDNRGEPLETALTSALKVFKAKGLVSPAGEDAWDVTHEALLRNWPRARAWVDADFAAGRSIGEAMVNKRVDQDQLNSLKEVLGWRTLPIYTPQWIDRAASDARKRVSTMARHSRLPAWLQIPNSVSAATSRLTGPASILPSPRFLHWPRVKPVAASFTAWLRRCFQFIKPSDRTRVRFSYWYRRLGFSLLVVGGLALLLVAVGWWRSNQQAEIAQLRSEVLQSVVIAANVIATQSTHSMPFEQKATELRAAVEKWSNARSELGSRSNHWYSSYWLSGVKSKINDVKPDLELAENLH